MKVKIKGLVFVGFAAAVFAQSALATVNDSKTVTSKLYVDSKVENTTGTGEQNDPYVTTISPSNAHADDRAPSIRNVYEFVTNQVGAITPAVGSNATNYVDFTEDGNTLTVNFDQAPVTVNEGITGTLTETNGTTVGTADKLVTAGAVKSLIDTSLSDAANAENDTTMPTSLAVVNYAEKKANKATSITTGDGGNSTSDTAYPTTKAVYDFVTTQGGAFQPKVERTGPSVGIRTGSGTSESPYIYTWGGIQAQGGNTLTGTTDNYVTMTESSGVYSIGLASTMVSVDKADITSNNKKLMTAMGVNDYMTDLVWTTTDGTIASAYQNDARVPTVKNVYDFVTGQISTAGDDYQPKVGGADSYGTDSSKVMIGYTTRTGESPNYTYSSEWKPLSGSTYVTVSTDSNGGTVALTNLAADADVYGSRTTNDEKLVKAGSVRKLLDTTLSSAANAENDQTVPTSKAVVDYVTGLTGGLTIPTMPQECTTAAEAGGYCALVYGDADDTQSGVQAGLMWTVMAPVPSNP